jgi:DNA-binding NarL/FixJ family response regulator
VKVLVLTRHGDEGYLQQLLRAGASGYVLKQSKATEVVNAVRAVASGRKFLDPMVTDTVIAGFSRRPHATATPGAQTTLTPREEEILRLVAWGYSNKEIAAQLGLSVKTVETHKANASQKLGLQHRIDIVRFALLRGWLDVA